MKNSKFVIFIIIVLGGIVLYFFLSKTPLGLISNNSPINSVENLSLINQITYLCQNNKTIKAFFYEGKVVPVKPGEPPIPSGQVKLILSDGRQLGLSQTISADGVRYANSDETFIFWSKGNGALVLENNEEKNYVGCIALANDNGDLPNAYLDSIIGFTIRYPKDYSVDPDYKYLGLGPGKEISGVKFIIPKNLADGTNLSSFDTGVSVETLSNVSKCHAALFLNVHTDDLKTVSDNGQDYSFVSSIEGAAGNIYEEQVWAFPRGNYCIALRYLIHSTNIQNYTEGQISEFDRAILLEQFDKIRYSLINL